MQIGYTLSSEEFSPSELIKNAIIAEDAGFSFLSISDHYHPWVDNQGHSPFVWSVIGGLSQTTSKIKVMTGVSCPILRVHPAIIAQAAATSQEMLEGRFILGLGTGENLNEHVVGRSWPPIEIRQEMLIEAIKIIKQLLEGGYQSYWGKYFNLDAARIYTLPKDSVPIIMAASGTESAKIAGKIADGLVSTGPDQSLTHTFEVSGGKNKPKFAQINLCFDKSREKAREIATKIWPNSALPSPLNVELRLPADFEKAVSVLSSDQIVSDITLGPDTDSIMQQIEKYQKAGFNNIYLHNIGPNQEQFIQYAKKAILPNFREETKTSRKKESGVTYPTAYAHTVKK